MTIADNLKRISDAKANIKESIENKGVSVPDTALLDEYPALIDKIEGGGEGGGPNPYQELYMRRTNNATNMTGLFAYYNFSELDLSDFDTSKATNMNYMFYGCNSLTSLNLSGFDTSNVTDMSDMFSYCKTLISLNLSNWNTNKVTDMSDMFCYCNKLTPLDLSGFDTSNVTSMSSMFSYCKALISLNVSSFDTSKITNLIYTFQNCENLTSLDLSNWDVSKCTTTSAFSSTFYGCKALTDFKAPKNISTAFNFSSCPNLTHDSLMSIINNLSTVTSTKKLTLGATNLAKLTNEEKAIATNKGWTLA
jgi:surface protein